MNSPADATDWMLLQAGMLYPYDRSTAIYKCPADIQPSPKSLEVTVRSYSMNTYMNGYDVAAVLEGVQGLYTVQTKCSQVFSPVPARRLVFADECENSIDDSNFGVIPSMLGTDHSPINHWNNYPTARHGNAGTFSFADGHALAFKWKGQLLKTLETSNVPGNYTADVSGSDLNDLRQVQAAMALPAGQN